jgi:hypothetical protein
MAQPSAHGISRQGLNATFEIEETPKSQLLLRAALLREQGEEETAAALFAEAAAIEEHRGGLCTQQGLIEKSFVHRFSAASSWAQAGNFYQAILLCQRLLEEESLSSRLRERIESYVESLRRRRSEWYAELLSQAA